MAVTSPTHRTHYRVTLDLACEIASHGRHVRLFDRIHGWSLVLMAVLAGSVGVAGWQQVPWLAGILTATLVAVSIFEGSFNVAERRVRHALQRVRYIDLQSRQRMLTAEEIDAERSVISKDDPPEYFAIKVVTQNETLRSEGHESQMHALAKRSERFLAWLA
jgi:hypothetical protein